MTPTEVAQQARQAFVASMNADEDSRNSALLAIALRLEERAFEIITANKKDVAEGLAAGVNEALLDRLELNQARIKDMAQGVRDIAAQPAVVGEIVESVVREDGLEIKKERVPIGVLAMIFESRPNVIVDGSCLAIKSGNAIILKGGKEAKHSNRILVEIVRQSIASFIPINLVQMVEAREDVSELLGLSEYIDLMIPRGRESLIRYVYDNAKMPVIAHFAGLCHGYIHKDANLQQALEICLNAKAQRPAVCNAMETLLLHKDLPQEFFLDLKKALLEAGVEMRVSENLRGEFAEAALATEHDWDTEYLDKILSIKKVDSVAEAIAHIQEHGTHHTEFICAQDAETIERFRREVDASCILVNASSRFNDGSQLGLGAELGISTSKIHAYGPMGAKEMTTVRYLVFGHGHVRA